MELDGLVMVETGRKGREVTVGTVGLRARSSPSLSDGEADSVEGADTVEGVDAATTNAAAGGNATVEVETTTLGGGIMGGEKEEGAERKMMDTRFFSPLQPLPSLKVFLTVIRALAEIAEKETDGPVEEFVFEDEEMGVEIRFDAVTPTGGRDGVGRRDEVRRGDEGEVTTTYGNLAESLSVIVGTMVKLRRFAACKGEMYKVPDPQRPKQGRKLVGVVVVKGVGKEDGRVESA